MPAGKQWLGLDVPVVEDQAVSLTRIADALERIATALEHRNTGKLWVAPTPETMASQASKQTVQRDWDALRADAARELADDWVIGPVVGPLTTYFQGDNTHE